MFKTDPLGQSSPNFRPLRQASPLHYDLDSILYMEYNEWMKMKCTFTCMNWVYRYTPFENYQYEGPSRTVHDAQRLETTISTRTDCPLLQSTRHVQGKIAREIRNPILTDHFSLALQATSIVGATPPSSYSASSAGAHHRTANHQRTWCPEISRDNNQPRAAAHLHVTVRLSLLLSRQRDHVHHTIRYQTTPCQP